MRFRSDLYRGTAEYYERFRPGYPRVLLDDLRARVPITGTGRLLDLACGTGQIAFALASAFVEVVAVDQEPDSIELGKRKATRLGVANVDWRVARAETVALGAPFELIAIGNAFHRLDRELVARRVAPWLRQGGCVALLWSDPPWRGERPWQRGMSEALEDWTRRLGAVERVPWGWQRLIEQDPHAEVLRRAGLAYEGRFEFRISRTWRLETLLGFVYSTSFLNRTVLGERVDQFERDLREWLGACGGDDDLPDDSTAVYELARGT